MTNFATSKPTMSFRMSNLAKYYVLQHTLHATPRTTYGRDFLSELNECVYKLMPRGEAYLDKVAAQLKVSPSKLRRQIQNYTGITPANYLMMLRMGEAIRLLDVYPRYTISTIAMLCGFSDHSHFTHTFTRFFSQSPMQYVQEHGLA